MDAQGCVYHRCGRVAAHAGGAGGVVDCPRTQTEIGDQVGVGLHLRAGAEFFVDQFGEGGLGCDVAQVFHSLQHLLNVMLGRIDIGRDGRMRQRVGRMNADMPA